MNKKLPLQQEAASEEIKQMLAGNHSKHQCVRMLQALWLFKLNTFEASRGMNVYHLPAGILQLWQQGDEIDTIWKTVKAENSIKHHVDCYVRVMNNESRLERLEMLLVRFSHLGIGVDVVSLGLIELWALYCYLSRLGNS